ncbi:helix-turn-helix domain-containing protein [Streptomyces sp. NPDC047315]|uniref:helix-turn-helix domain-containing protein n=1 Tax=Streptomyces sp. NPDC047315 TaxID=3155142 RepID=UPI0033FAE1AE
MEALAARLSQLDARAEGAIRIVMFYDTLMRRRVDLPALARASAGLAECVVGVRLDGTGWTARVRPDGSGAPEPADASAAASAVSTEWPITLDDEVIGTVWLERPGAPGPLDEAVLDRFAIAVTAVVERYGPARTTMADPALVELAVSADCDEAARARALRLLGFAVDAPVHVVVVRVGAVRAEAVRSPRLPLDRIGALICPDGLVKAAPLPDVGVLLATAVDRAAFPAGVRAGLGGGVGPDRSFAQARTALRFTTEREPVLAHADLGALALLARVPPDAVRADPDVSALAAVANAPDGAADLATLDAYCATGSLRGAAELLHLHHSSVARRVERIGGCLGVDVTTPRGLLRASLALTAWRLLPDADGPGGR